MKQLTCEMCGSTELMKQDGVFVCQTCGTKYSVEEAKKMMIEGTVEVQGTVKVDTSDELPKLYQAARNARATSDNASAIKHYENISAKDPNSWEAMFYLAILKTNSIKNGEIASAAVRVCNCLPKVFELINITIGSDEEKKKAVKEVVEQCFATVNWLIGASDNFYKVSTKGNGMIALTGITGMLSSANATGQAINEAKDRLLNIANILETCGNYIEKNFDMNDEQFKSFFIMSWDKMLNIQMIFKSKFNNNLFKKEFIANIENKINNYDKSYIVTKEKNKQQQSIKDAKAFATMSLAMFFSGPTALVFGCIALSKPIPEKYKKRALVGTVLSALWTLGLLFLWIYLLIFYY